MSAPPILERFSFLQKKLSLAAGKNKPPLLIAVSKGVSAEDIRPLLEAGHRLFGENYIPESEKKWPALRAEFPDIMLHLIGSVQSRKLEQALALFDVIQTLDRPKIAALLASKKRSGVKIPQLFIQVNTGLEPQKSGVFPAELAPFIQLCRGEYGLSIEGLMCLPPVHEDPEPHFMLLSSLARENHIADLSMGMSGDYETATACGASYVRLGTALFGSRNT